MVKTVVLLVIANLFMTYAWYGHLKDLKSSPIMLVIVVSWSIALFEYCFQVPANRLGYQVMSLAQLKVTQEIITMGVFAGFAVIYMKAPITRDFLYAGICLAGAAYFMFRNGLQ